MSEQVSSVSSLLVSLLLSDAGVLHKAWREPFVRPLRWTQWREVTYLAYHPWAARYPDHVFDAAWRSLHIHQRDGESSLLGMLQLLVEEYLENRHGSIHVRRSLFGAWQQSLISRISSVPLHAMARVHFARQEYFSADRRIRETSLADGVFPLLRPYDALVEDYVAREGLHESHLHLNGSTHAEVCWLRAVRAPKAETNHFVRAWTEGRNSLRVRELVGQVNPNLSPAEFSRQLQTAAGLRAWLVAASTGRVDQHTLLPQDCEALCSGEANLLPPVLHDLSLDLTSTTTVSDEIRWQTMLLERLRQTPSIQLERMLHCYLLLQNQYYRLMVQSETQFGFDQFQKFTLTDLREPAEKDYLHRFQAMHGCSPTVSRTGYLEGRFAPKDSLPKTYKLLHAILGGYWRYLSDVTGWKPSSQQTGSPLSWLLQELERFFQAPEIRHRSIHRLALVAHFIKQPWSPQPANKAGPYRHFALETHLRQATGVLLAAISRWPRLKTWIRGIDGAANELHAPPDPFAPIFRACRRAGLTHRSFHAGEDFPHLLSGLRYMWDALELLNLRDGDRIGHGTAMGIRPALWLERMPSKVSITRGDWMLSVLSAWQLLRDTPAMHMQAGLLHRELEAVACEVFGEWIGATRLERAMSLRGLSSAEVHRFIEGQRGWGEHSLNDHWRAEAELVEEVGRNRIEDLRLLWRWLSDPGPLERSYELIEKRADFLDGPTYVKLQQSLMRHVAERGVLIETLPTSNVRISQYHAFREHHALRWMRVPGHVEEGDPEIMVCLGSDDPGIFAGDLESEFHQLYCALRNEGISDTDALGRLSKINERGRIYRFHDRSLA
ncbi:hypothetical protein LJD21_15780 [Pseudomonas inefficax]|uniref:hypothetical protein n=1 Tax=Pseudomonas inefficax TaxID=2078786 RepID=UPI00207BBEE0|nr:hypothetical protein [Pseudomonas inefficax]MCM8913644.1 hypothetical protein [Pseudomonas inefficax]